MKIPAIKKLVESYDQMELREAEAQLVEDLPLAIEVEGDDEGEQLTHILAAIYIQEKMDRDKVDFKTALRDYTGRVRESIN
ncbi:MAG: DUF6952 family protein [Candidatus Cyclobacteriaceae bacterium M2_1C_046]